MCTAERHQSIDRALVDSLSAWLVLFAITSRAEQSRAEEYLNLGKLRLIGSDVPSAPSPLTRLKSQLLDS